jgi:16S rRNA (cytosine1402-N4)-methyltransferase
VPFVHESVLLKEAVSLLKPGVGKVIVDGTLGGGGHAEALLEAGADVLGVDRDPRAIAAARQRLARFGAHFSVAQGNFGQLQALVARERGGPVDGVLLDLGVSSPQFDDPERGFSFQAQGPLDMRMGDQGPTAAEWIDGASEHELAEALHAYGEEPFGKSIARELKRAAPKTTLEAAEAVKRAVPRKAWPKRIHVATRTFQALRIAVNGELDALDGALAALPSVLEASGVAAIISFHSLEDRKVKQAFRALEGRCTCPPGFPVCACGARGSFAPLTRKAVVASDEEVARNPRARSAHLRAVEKIR